MPAVLREKNEGPSWSQGVVCSAPGCAEANFHVKCGARENGTGNDSAQLPFCKMGIRMLTPKDCCSLGANSCASPVLCGYWGIVNACVNSYHVLFLSKFAGKDRLGKEKKKALVRGRFYLLLVMITTLLYQLLVTHSVLPDAVISIKHNAGFPSLRTF